MFTPLTSVNDAHHHATGLEGVSDFAGGLGRVGHTKLIEITPACNRTDI
jgi:hypothetical protein